MSVPAEVLEQLLFVLDETPEPPAADADPVEVLERAQVMAIRREAHIEAVKEHLGEVIPEGGLGLDDSTKQMLAELRDRDARWHAAIGRARRELGDRRASAARLNRLNRNQDL